MSQMAAEPAPRPRRENVFTRKIGPLPMWGWLLIAGALIGLWAWYSRSKQQQAAQQQAAASSAQVPQFVNQTFVSPSPPSAPPIPPRRRKHHRRDRDHDTDDQQVQRPQPGPGGTGGPTPTRMPVPKSGVTTSG